MGCSHNDLLERLEEILQDAPL